MTIYRALRQSAPALNVFRSSGQVGKLGCVIYSLLAAVKPIQFNLHADDITITIIQLTITTAIITARQCQHHRRFK